MKPVLIIEASGNGKRTYLQKGNKRKRENNRYRYEKKEGNK